MLKLLRKSFLFYVLILVAGGFWFSVKRTTSWEKTLWVSVYPINGDGSERSAEYISKLDSESFAVINEFLAQESKRHGVTINRPVEVVLGAQVLEQPPHPPKGANVLSIMLWSLKLRYWAWQVDKGVNPRSSNIEVYVRYFDPETNPRLAHSLGLQKGLIGVVNAFAQRSQAGSNKFIIAHELLHTLGATDKYDPATGQPVFPDGFADIDANPRYPQTLAEVMGGRIPVSAGESRIPKSLRSVVVGPATAREIGWQ